MGHFGDYFRLVIWLSCFNMCCGVPLAVHPFENTSPLTFKLLILNGSLNTSSTWLKPKIAFLTQNCGSFKTWIWSYDSVTWSDLVTWSYDIKISTSSEVFFEIKSVRNWIHRYILPIRPILTNRLILSHPSQWVIHSIWPRNDQDKHNENNPVIQLRLPDWNSTKDHRFVPG